MIYIKHCASRSACTSKSGTSAMIEKVTSSGQSGGRLADLETLAYTCGRIGRFVRALRTDLGGGVRITF